MDFKILIKCERCKCSFELRPVEFAARDRLQCVNCGQELDQEVFSHLKSGLIELEKVPDIVPFGAARLSLNGEEKPEFSLQVKEYNEYMEYMRPNAN